MLEEEIRHEIEILKIILELRSSGDITEYEIKKKNAEISDEAIIRVFKDTTPMPGERFLGEILIERMQAWSIERLIKSLTGDLDMVAREALIRTLVETIQLSWKGMTASREEFNRLKSHENPVVQEILSQAIERAEKIDKLRKEIGLRPRLVHIC